MVGNVAKIFNSVIAAPSINMVNLVFNFPEMPSIDGAAERSTRAPKTDESVPRLLIQNAAHNLAERRVRISSNASKRTVRKVLKIFS